jgi:hypothetical protein
MQVAKESAGNNPLRLSFWTRRNRLIATVALPVLVNASFDAYWFLTATDQAPPKILGIINNSLPMIITATVINSLCSFKVTVRYNNSYINEITGDKVTYSFRDHKLKTAIAAFLYTSAFINDAIGNIFYFRAQVNTKTGLAIASGVTGAAGTFILEGYPLFKTFYHLSPTKTYYNIKRFLAEESRLTIAASSSLYFLSTILNLSGCVDDLLETFCACALAIGTTNNTALTFLLINALPNAISDFCFGLENMRDILARFFSKIYCIISLNNKLINFKDSISFTAAIFAAAIIAHYQLSLVKYFLQNPDVNFPSPLPEEFTLDESSIIAFISASRDFAYNADVFQEAIDDLLKLLLGKYFPALFPKADLEGEPEQIEGLANPLLRQEGEGQISPDLETGANPTVVRDIANNRYRLVHSASNSTEPAPEVEEPTPGRKSVCSSCNIM